MKAKNPGALSGRTWTSILLFGLIGQIAWVVENMYFSRFMQNEITRAPYATTLMVAFSALFATLSTLLGGRHLRPYRQAQSVYHLGVCDLGLYHYGLCPDPYAAGAG